LVALLLIRLEQINAAMLSLDGNSAAEARIGAHLAGQAALVQQAVNRYLQQPQEIYRQQAQQALDAFKAEIAQQRLLLMSSAQQARAADLAVQLASYQDTFVALDTLQHTQITYRFDTSRWITQANALTNRFVYSQLSTKTTDKLNTLITTQSNLQSAAITASRMVAEQNPDLVDLVAASLKLAQTRLQGLLLDSRGDITLHDALQAATSAISSTNQLADNLKAMRQLRSTQLVERSDALQQGADAIAQGALATLTGATADLERQIHETQQEAVIALLGALVVTVLMGIQLSRTLTKPLNDLVVATGRINQGNFDQPVAEREGGEVGRLVSAFNLMAATLREQRAEVAHQHTLMLERNCDLERALERLQLATAERETLAATVQSLSVPVIPILEHVIVVPLVGELDRDRAELLQQRLLEGVLSQRARMVILDITGIAMIDSSGATWLLRAAGAVELLGARTILAGTSPEAAQALVASGADLSRLYTTVDLRAAVEYALRPVNTSRQLARR
jgi:rsbT co-antagonist protein RsbR